MVDSISNVMNGHAESMSRKLTSRPVNASCLLLNVDENKLIVQFLGKDRYTLATSIVQVLISQFPYHTKWVPHCTGVVCFVKDYIRRSYFFCVFSTKTGLVWEQEFYRGFEYNVITPIFHCFEASDSMAAFSFADSTDALRFGHVVISKIEDKKAKLTRRKEKQQVTCKEINNTYINSNLHLFKYSLDNCANNNRSCLEERKHSESFSNVFHFDQPLERRSSSPVENSIRRFPSIRDKINLRRRKLSKSEISNPICCTFEHREHIGIDGVRYGSNGIGESSTPSADFSEMLMIFQHRFPDLRECELSEVIEKYGGIDRLRNELNLQLNYAKQQVVCEKAKHRRPAPPPPPSNTSVSYQKFTACRSAPAPPVQKPGRPLLPPPSPPKKASLSLSSLENHISSIYSEPPLPPPFPSALSPSLPSASSTSSLQYPSSSPPLAPPLPSTNQPIAHKLSIKSPIKRNGLLDEICNPNARQRLKPIENSNVESKPVENKDSLLDAIKLFNKNKLRPTNADDKTLLQDKDSMSSITTSPITQYKLSSASMSSRSEDFRTSPSKSTSGSMMDQIKQELERRRRLMDNSDQIADHENSESESGVDATQWSTRNTQIESEEDEWTSGDQPVHSPGGSSVTAF